MLIGHEVEYSFIQGKGEIILKRGIILDKILMTPPKDKPTTESSVTGYIVRDNESNKILHIVYWRIVNVIVK
jgi:hypothetical protein